jgi:hypothetical protein
VAIGPGEDEEATGFADLDGSGFVHERGKKKRIRGLEN